MNTLDVPKLKKEDSLEEFYLLDTDPEEDLDIDLTKSPLHDAAQKMNKGVVIIISALCTLVEKENMIIKPSMAVVATTAVGAVTGSLIGGPPGLLVGIITGAVMAYSTSQKCSKGPQKHSLKTIRQIFKEMPWHQKKDLVKELLLSLKHSNVRALLIEILKNEKIRNIALNILSEFLLKKTGISLLRPKAP